MAECASVVFFVDPKLPVDLMATNCINVFFYHFDFSLHLSKMKINSMDDLLLKLRSHCCRLQAITSVVIISWLRCMTGGIPHHYLLIAVCYAAVNYYLFVVVVASTAGVSTAANVNAFSESFQLAQKFSSWTRDDYKHKQSTAGCVYRWKHQCPLCWTWWRR